MSLSCPGERDTSRLQRNAGKQETVRTPCPVPRAYPVRPFIRGNKAPTSSSNLFIYCFYFFFFSKKARKTSHLRRIALGDTEFNRTHRCFEVAEVRDVGLSRQRVYTFSTSSREKNYQPFEGKIGLRFHFVLIFIDFLFSFYYLRYEFDFALQRVNQCSSLLYHVRCNFESQMNLFFFFFFKAQS